MENNSLEYQAAYWKTMAENRMPYWAMPLVMVVSFGFGFLFGFLFGAL